MTKNDYQGRNFWESESVREEHKFEIFYPIVGHRPSVYQECDRQYASIINESNVKYGSSDSFSILNTTENESFMIS